MQITTANCDTTYVRKREAGKTMETCWRHGTEPRGEPDNQICQQSDPSHIHVFSQIHSVHVSRPCQCSRSSFIFVSCQLDFGQALKQLLLGVSHAIVQYRIGSLTHTAGFALATACHAGDGWDKHVKGWLHCGPARPCLCQRPQHISIILRGAISELAAHHCFGIGCDEGSNLNLICLRITHALWDQLGPNCTGLLHGAALHGFHCCCHCWPHIQNCPPCCPF